jgi:hypothetical protein
MLAGKYKIPGFKPVYADPPKPHVRSTPKPPSLNPSQTGAPQAAKPPTKTYTGTDCIGITTLHKSNAVPVFNHQAAIDAAQMRRN